MHASYTETCTPSALAHEQCGLHSKAMQMLALLSLFLVTELENIKVHVAANLYLMLGRLYVFQLKSKKETNTVTERKDLSPEH